MNTMAETATSTATAAAATKPATTSLQTPLSASYPSELRSPMLGTLGFIKQEEGMKTPITPPVAYLDFLKNLSPGLMSPMTGNSSRFSYGDTNQEDPTEPASSERPSYEKSSICHPPLSRKTSSGSTSSTSSGTTEKSSSSLHSSQEKSSFCSSFGVKSKPQSPRIVIPPSPFVLPMSARTPRRINIPQSPFSPVNARSPMSARSLHSPYSASALSAAPWSATYSPDDTEAERKGKSSRVCVRQVVTRTVTYAKTPLDPAPKGKRRKIEEATE